MKNRKVKNPLIKRIPREFLGDWKKYLVVSLFLILTIGFVSGMYVANGSMMKASDEGVSKYKLEDGHFELNRRADEKLLSAIQYGEKADVKQYYLDKAREEMQDEINKEYADAEEKYELNNLDFKTVPVKLYENFYRNEEEDHNNDGTFDGTVRVFAKTDEINLACVMDGRFPETEDEIAVDRMHADNVGIKVGDKITVGEQSYTVVGRLKRQLRQKVKYWYFHFQLL